jgi:hypothetical protein
MARVFETRKPHGRRGANASVSAAYGSVKISADELKTTHAKDAGPPSKEKTAIAREIADLL